MTEAQGQVHTNGPANRQTPTAGPPHPVTQAQAGANAQPGGDLLQVMNLKKYFPIMRGIIFSRQIGAVRAVDGVSFSIRRGETLGLVGESGCGKTTTGRLILRLLEPTAGKVIFDGQDIFALPADKMRAMRRQMQIIFQDPYASLNPRMTVGDIIGEPMEIHGIARGKERERRVKELLDVVGLAPHHARRYPHEFSGGQRQRIGVARALAVNPKLIICDEPVSALDVSIQAQVLNLLQDLQREFGLTYLFIAHDLSVVKHISNRVAVMYLGKIVELADKSTIYDDPRHPYTQALLSAIPIPDPTVKKERIILQGDVPSPVRPPSGCRFHTRCPHADERCSAEEPQFADVGGGHWVACHYQERLRRRVIRKEEETRRSAPAAPAVG
ncbi:MAG: dipeptide ABC transporter ATP-binding protein [Firmicutes bacterium]|nr:dipeptide ABC transporter ATP-binding protein [Bacillota bacterium]